MDTMTLVKILVTLSQEIPGAIISVADALKHDLSEEEIMQLLITKDPSEYFKKD